MGLTRGKNDAIDAARIAEYAYRYSDKVCLKKCYLQERQIDSKTPVSNSPSTHSQSPRLMAGCAYNCREGY